MVSHHSTAWLISQINFNWIVLLHDYLGVSDLLFGGCYFLAVSMYNLEKNECVGQCRQILYISGEMFWTLWGSSYIDQLLFLSTFHKFIQFSHNSIINIIHVCRLCVSIKIPKFVISFSCSLFLFTTISPLCLILAFINAQRDYPYLSNQLTKEKWHFYNA